MDIKEFKMKIKSLFISTLFVSTLSLCNASANANIMNSDNVAMPRESSNTLVVC